MQPKPQLESKMNWLGVIVTIVSVLGLLQGEEWIQQYPQVVAGLGIAAGFLTVILRQFTVKPVRKLFDNGK